MIFCELILQLVQICSRLNSVQFLSNILRCMSFRGVSYFPSYFFSKCFTLQSLDETNVLGPTNVLVSGLKHLRPKTRIRLHFMRHLIAYRLNKKEKNLSQAKSNNTQVYIVKILRKIMNYIQPNLQPSELFNLFILTCAIFLVDVPS